MSHPPMIWIDVMDPSRENINQCDKPIPGGYGLMRWALFQRESIESSHDMDRLTNPLYEKLTEPLMTWIN